jgi:hypothetical protein
LADIVAESEGLASSETSALQADTKSAKEDVKMDGGGEKQQGQVDFKTGEGVPSWKVKISGKLLPVRTELDFELTYLIVVSIQIEGSDAITLTPSKTDELDRKFTSLIKKLKVEILDREFSDPADSNLVEVSLFSCCFEHSSRSPLVEPSSVESVSFWADFRPTRLYLSHSSNLDLPFTGY